jgi:uncharacterized protein YigA (DUF484 family)
MVQKKDIPILDNSIQEVVVEPSSSITADEAASFLENNPEFFSDRQELLSKMLVPSRWSGDGVVDMQRFLADRRLKEIDDLRGCAQEVIETSRSNMSVQTRTHAAVLALLKGTSISQLLRIISDDLPMLLNVDFIVLGFEPPGLKAGMPMSADVEILDLNTGDVDHYLGKDKDIVLMRDIDKSLSRVENLFGAASDLVRSAGFARLCSVQEIPLGFIGLGTRKQTFSPGQGTEMISFLARALEICLYRAKKNEI